jgi:hopanoid biosynthesis associated RND transporter like protein HpnN
MRGKILSFIARIVIKHPWKIVLVSIVLSVLSVIATVSFLQMNTDQDDLVSEKIAYHKRYKDYLKEFGDLEYLFAVVETGDTLPRAKDFARTLANKLSEIPDVKEVTYQISNPKLEKSFLLYLPVDQIKSIGGYLPKMERINSASDVFAMMNESVTIPDNNQQQMEMGFRFLDNLLDGIIASTKDGAPYAPFLQQAFFGGEQTYDEDGFLLSEKGNFLFVMIMPEKNYKTLAVINEPLEKIRKAFAETKKEFPDISAGLTGRPVLAADEMSISDTDMTLATIASLIIVTLIFILYFKKPFRPAMAAIALCSGIAQTFGFITITIGHLNILSIVFAVILVGAGIEYGLQIVSRYREELASHKNVKAAIETCIIHTGKGNITATATTAAAFFAACFTDFLAMQELGFIAGFGIIICLINMFTLLPAMMYLHDKAKHPDMLETTLRINIKKFEKFYKRPKITLAITVIATSALALSLLQVKFNHNLLDLQANGLESVKYEKKIIKESSQSTWYAPFVVESREESSKLAEKLKTLPSIGKIETIAGVVPAEQEEKIKLISTLKNSFSNSKTALPKRPLETELKVFQENLARLSEMAFSSGRTDAVEALENISKKVDETAQLIKGHETRLSNYETGFIADLKKHIELLKGGLNPEPISIDDLPESIQRRYISPSSGRYSVYAYPKEDIWKPRKMKAFIKDIRSIDPNVTGTPVEVYESSRLLEKSFKQAAFFAMFAIIIIVMLDFRNLKLALFALAPLALGILWLFELMGTFGIRFNLANFFGIPILLGVGVDNAVQIVHRYIKERDKQSVSFFMTRSTGIAVLLTSLTTLASFGTLVFARHQGIASLGLIMSLGTISCFIASMIILPCILKVFGTKEA